MSYAHDVYLPQVPAGEAARAARISAATYRNWISRNPPIVHLSEEEREQFGDRTFFRLSLQSVYQLAIVAHFVARGLQPSQSAELARQFTLFGSDGNKRLPAQLYSDGYTLLIVDDQIRPESIYQVTDWKQLPSIIASEERTTLVANISKIVWDVHNALGLPRELNQEMETH